MINVTLKGEQVSVKPATLNNYIEKVDYIKSRRVPPFDTLRSLQGKIPQDKYDRFMETAISSSMRMSSVILEEEYMFEGSWEGIYYRVYQALKDHFKWNGSVISGVNEAEKFYDSLSEAERTSLNLAIRGVDERTLVKKLRRPDPPAGVGQRKQPTRVTIGNLRKKKVDRGNDWMGMALEVSKTCHITLAESKSLTLLEAWLALGWELVDG